MPADQIATSRALTEGRSRRGLILVCGLLLLAGAGYYWLQSGETIVEDQPLIVSVEIGSIVNTIAASGSLQPSSLVDVGAQVSGQLQKLYVEVGDLVNEGQLLAEIDARVQENRVAASRASIEALEAQIAARNASLQLAHSNTDRQERLMAANATSQLDYDNAITSLASAESSLIQLEKQIIQSRASLASDVTQLEYSRIYAPAGGTVVSIEMNEGRTLNANQQAPTILRIADLSLMTVETEISEADIGNVKQGLDVYFTTLGGGARRWHSTLRQILPTPTVENNVVLYTGLFDINNDDAALFAEMTAQVYFITSSAENVLIVPVGALTYKEEAAGNMGLGGNTARPAAGPGPSARNSPNGSNAPSGSGNVGQRPPRGGNAVPPGGRRLATVELVNDDGAIDIREVVIGVTSRVSAEVLSGLSVGDKVVAGILQSNSSSQNQQNQGFRPPGFGRF